MLPSRIDRAIAPIHRVGPGHIEETPVRRRSLGIQFTAVITQDDALGIRPERVAVERDITRFDSLIEHDQADTLARRIARTSDAADRLARHLGPVGEGKAVPGIQRPGLRLDEPRIRRSRSDGKTYARDDCRDSLAVAGCHDRAPSVRRARDDRTKSA
jgi:hypothetical protein